MVEYFSTNCEMFKEERDGKQLKIGDIFGPIEKQITFIKSFKLIARKWKLIQEIC